MSGEEGLGPCLLPWLQSLPLTLSLLWCRVPLESEGLVAWLVPREPMVTPVVLENLVFLEPG